MITFQLSHHTIRHCEVVDIFLDGKHVAALYQAADNNPNLLRFQSNHVTEVRMEGQSVPIQGYFRIDFLTD